MKNKSARFFLAMVAVFILSINNTAYSADKANQSAKNNKWVKSLHDAALGLESQQTSDIVSFIEKRLVMGKFNPKLKKIEALEKKKISNPIFLVLITEEDKKNSHWKEVKFSSAAQFIPAIQAIVIDERAEFSEEGMAIMLAREYWIAYYAIKGSYDGDTKWNAYAFLIRCMVSLGGEGYISLVYDEASKLAKEFEENVVGWRSYSLVEPITYDERLSFALWEPASDEEALFMQRCFWIHIVFIMIENNPGLGYVAEQKAEFIKSLSPPGNILPAGDSVSRDYYKLYVK
ncbi:MAG: hypothetical protein NTY33_02950 [Candidatus Moranbacteria bacterium]|nr:hypothetical protein [Candidatus Moranbacteria bacterium]